jgi:recombinational DNA repair protein (RecF pathway)
MQPDRNNPPALVRDAGKQCPDCREHRPASAFYLRRNGQLSAYCRPHQRQRAKASYRRRRQDPAELARMREADRIRKRASRARRNALGARGEAQLARSRATAARRLIAAHLDEYRALLEAERRQLRASTTSGGGPDAA